MSNKAHQLVSHAARLLDLRGDVAGAEAALREAIRLSESEGNWITQVQASAFLGEVLAETSRPDDALDLFESVVNLGVRAGNDVGAIDHELQIAREYLAKAASPGTGG